MKKKRNEITTKFKDSLRAFLPQLSRNNHHIAFLHDQISREFCVVQEQIDKALATAEEASDSIDLVLHPLPLDSKQLPFLPMFTALGDPVYGVEDDQLFSWISRNRAPGSYFQMSKGSYVQKDSWVVKKILSLSEDFIKELLKISNEAGIPFEALHNMYILMTAIEDFFQSPENYALLEPYLYYPVPSSISDKERDALILSAWNRVYNLLVECYWVVLIVGLVDLLTVLGTYQKEGLEEARKYLIHSTVYSELERRIVLIMDRAQMLAYLQEEFSVFESFLPDFAGFLEKSLKQIAKKGERRLNIPITPMVDDFLPKKHATKKPSPSEIEDETVKESVLSEWEDGIDHKDLEGFHMSEEDETSRKEKEKPEKKAARKAAMGDMSFLLPDLVQGIEQKMLTGWLKNYRLTGTPDRVVHYLFKTFSNLSKTITEKTYNENLKAQYDTSLTTFRRWLKEIRDGKIVLDERPDRPGGIRGINDLFEADIDETKRTMQARKEHRDGKTLSQNQLINELQKDWLLDQLRKKGVRLKKYSRTNLRNKIKALTEKNLIPFTKKGKSNRFLPEDIVEIARRVSRPIPD